jgi:hypothetical protein
MGSLLLTVLVTTIYALWTVSFIVNLRIALGGIFLSFQANRVHWINPMLWFFIFAVSLSLLSGPVKYTDGESLKNKAIFLLRKGIALICFILISLNLYNQSPVQINIERIRTPHHSHSSWKGFFMVDVFDEIAEQIDKSFNTYRVASIGIHPSVALYNGFYTIDGYSNNYRLDHQLEFRLIIANELEKNDVLRSYFDNWGNRAYIFIDQLEDQRFNPDPRRNNEIILTEINLNIDQMRNMGVHYIFSASEINSPYMTGLILFGEFQSSQRDTKIWVYEIPQ